MIASTAASLVNLLGFITGVVLYVMLLWMVLTARFRMECRGVWRLWNGEPGFQAIGAGAAGGGFQLLGLSSCRRCAFRTAHGRSDTRPVPGARSDRVCDERNCDDHEYVHRHHSWN